MLSKQYRGVGIYQYAKNLFFEFKKLIPQRPDLSFCYFVSPEHSERFLLDEPQSPRYYAHPTSLLNRGRLWQMGMANVAAAKAHAKVLFSPAPVLLPMGVPAVVTIHDIMPLKLPLEMMGRRAAYQLGARFWVAAKLATKIITDSEHSKKDISETFSIDPQKIEVVYLGYDKSTFNTNPVETGAQRELSAKYGIERPYIVHHGLVQSRKNVLGLIEAYEILASKESFDFDLVLAGGFGHGSEEMKRKAAGIKKGRVIFTGPLSDDEIGMILKGASLAVIPSFYEGFCLPIVEAMASGIPTIGADNSCIPEVTGNVLRYFDAHSSQQMAEVMREVLESADLQKTLIASGLKRASEFNWERCARETLDVISNSRI